MNLRVVSQGSLNTLAIEPDLLDSIKRIQGYDSEAHKIKRYLAEGKPSFFTIAEDGTLYFKGRLVVPCAEKNLDMTQEVMKEAHDTPLCIHPGCQDRVFGMIILQKMALVLTSPKITVS